MVFEDLSIKIEGAEIVDQYKTEYGPSREAPAGMKFLWVQLFLENSGVENIDLPEEDHFSALYGTEEYKPTYGHRDGYKDYISLGDTLFPRDPQHAWLRFDIPAQAELKDIQFAFLPDSTRVSFSRTQSGSSYYDHPVFIWALGLE
ncbi:MAG: hypothetical protein AB9891_04220 [Anaerolineaceae bacterium]